MPTPEKRVYRARYKHGKKYITLKEVATLANLSVYYTRSLIRKGYSAEKIIKREYPLKSAVTKQVNKFGFPSVTALAESLGVTRQWIYNKHKRNYRLKKVNGKIVWYAIQEGNEKNRGAAKRSVPKRSIGEQAHF